MAPKHPARNRLSHNRRCNNPSHASRSGLVPGDLGFELGDSGAELFDFLLFGLGFHQHIHQLALGHVLDRWVENSFFLGLRLSTRWWIPA